ncbi:hypothetical protein FRB94_014201 [Tulasnella sp. JGI-2019a]|nr:hypothetical protein FRB93_005451 [Tulasnella sp. JGI-2019a]KAG9014109.1 hypothetical protein FRB94_014201 [Tulasnella sp. JGI-2019a]KAG9028796.1 hypothetical protein FRB95_006076 [Tulasnella sp. JGI-2019a]
MTADENTGATTSIATEPTVNQEPIDSTGTSGLGTTRFWLVFASLMMATFVSALDVTAVSTALPTIVYKLHGSEFTWVGSAYALASTAFLPMSGGMAQIFGRKPVLLGFLGFFIVGSAVCGASTSLNMLIAGRTVQGVGSGGILSLTEIIVADLVPLAQRGLYMGLIGMVWAVAAASGPPIGGAFSDSSWRWLFYMNVPLTAIAIVGVAIFLNVRAPKDDFRSKMKRMDWIGNFIVVAATSATIIGLTWGGVRYPWSSFRVVVPLVLGLVGLVAFLAYEAKYPLEPVVPWKLVKNRTTLSGYLITFFHGIVVACIFFYLPVYFQAVKSQSAVHSGVTLLATAATVAPGAIVCGASVTILKMYRPQNFLGWALLTIGTGLVSLLTYSTTEAGYVGYQILAGVGMGILYPSPSFAILASQPLSETAHALALFAFVRQFANTWGITIGSTILQNGLKKHLPASIIDQLSASSGGVGNEIAYAVIPIIHSLPEDLKVQTQVAFATSLQLIWHVMLGICGVGMLSVFLMKEIPMQEVTAEEYGMKDKKTKVAKVGDEEKATTP